jgi:ribosomal protein S18 acetylase RimI-like enzyme
LSVSITIRPARAEDRAHVSHLLGAFMDYLNAIEPGETPAAPAERAALIERLLDLGFGPRPVCATLVAERDGTVVGYVSHHPGVWEIYRAIYVISLYVDEAARGSGAGKALMDAVRDLARAEGAEVITWEVWSKNPAAIGFYERLGGRVYGENLRMSWMVEAR